MEAIQLSQVGKQVIENSRMDYLTQLPVFQELYMEMLVDEGTCFQILYNGLPAGYAVKTGDGILTEFHLHHFYVPFCTEIFEKVISGLRIEKIYCKSFDFLLMSCCLAKSFGYTIIGTLFRERIPSENYEIRDWKVRLADESDYSFLLAQEDGLYDTPEELETFIARRCILMYSDAAGQLLGCGYLIRIHPGFDYYDIGMWVHPARRRQGFATSIISHLKNECLRSGWTPVCGCAAGNLASQRTLEKNGFISRYKLVEFHTGF